MDVILKRCEEYDYNAIKNIIEDIFIKLDCYKLIDKNKKVFIKLNCVGPFDYSYGITTHPVVLKAVIDVLKTITSNIYVGDNPATRDLTYTLKKCGLYDVILSSGAHIINNTILKKIYNKNASIYQSFEVSEEMVDVDVIINLPKLKTHSLAYMTVAMKNFFGLVYGLNKSAWHVLANNPLDFGNAMCDLYGALLNELSNKPIINICDGIIGLEGEGPSTGGNKKAGNVILASLDAISLDRIACEVVSLDQNHLFMTNIASSRGLGEGDITKINIIGDSLSQFDDIKFKAPKDSLSNIGLRFLQHKTIRNLLLEHPYINTSKCIKCGECAKICPPKTMILEKNSFPRLNAKNCIRCWCCQEVCPKNAIDKTKRPFFGKVFLKS